MGVNHVHSKNPAWEDAHLLRNYHSAVGRTKDLAKRKQKIYKLRIRKRSRLDKKLEK